MPYVRNMVQYSSKALVDDFQMVKSMMDVHLTMMTGLVSRRMEDMASMVTSLYGTQFWGVQWSSAVWEFVWIKKHFCAN